MRKLLFGLSIMVLGFASTTYAQTQKIGYIDLQRVIIDSEAGKSAKSAFEEEFQSKRVIIDQKRKALDDLKQDFIKNGAVMSEAKRKSMANNIEKKQKELDRTMEDFRSELQKRDLELTQKILKDIEGIVKQIGDEEGFSIILEKTEAGLLYGGESADITDKIISVYDAQ